VIGKAKPLATARQSRNQKTPTTEARRRGETQKQKSTVKVKTSLQRAQGKLGKMRSLRTNGNFFAAWQESDCWQYKGHEGTQKRLGNPKNKPVMESPGTSGVSPSSRGIARDRKKDTKEIAVIANHFVPSAKSALGTKVEALLADPIAAGLIAAGPELCE